MRTLLKLKFPVEPGNVAVKNGTLQKIMESTLGRLKPEAAYFYTQEGHRGGIIVFDMKDSSEMPAIAEPFFMGLNATVEFMPVMSVDDLQAGLKVAAENF